MVSVVVPCRDEARHIKGFVQSMLLQQPPDGGFELIVADGVSSDGTRALLREMSNADDTLRVIDNERRYVSSGLNQAIAAARGDIVIRADVHTDYANDYLRQCVQVLRETGADNVGGPWIVAQRGYLGSAIALGFRSKFGSGGARAHDPAYEGEVDTVYLGCWRKACLEEVGGFDEELVRNQDDELNLRLKRAGKVIWQSPRIRSTYHPRGSLLALFRQYVQYGYWKVRVIRKHRMPASLRHLVPAIFVLTMACLAALSVVRPPVLPWLGLVSGVYLAISVAAAIAAVRGANPWVLPVLPVVFICFHVGYGYGFLLGVLDFVILGRKGRADMTSITRHS